MTFEHVGIYMSHVFRHGASDIAVPSDREGPPHLFEQITKTVNYTKRGPWSDPLKIDTHINKQSVVTLIFSNVPHGNINNRTIVSQTVI